MIIQLIRTQTGLTGTNGFFYVNGEQICGSIELPWQQNLKDLSCIPVGQYELQPYKSENFRGQPVYEVKGVPNRSFILIHPANQALTELRGCISPVTSHQPNTIGMGWKSRDALKKLHDAIESKKKTANEKLYLQVDSIVFHI